MDKVTSKGRAVQRFRRGDQVALAHGITDPEGARIPEGTPGVVLEPWPIMSGKRGATEFRYVVTFELDGRELPKCFVDDAALEPMLYAGGLFQ